MNLERTGTAFETTSWSIVRSAAAEDPSKRKAALEFLVERYWPAVYGFLRRSGRRPEEAAEHTQAFFAEVVLGRGLFERADSARGRLRTLLLKSLGRYLIDDHRRSTARPVGAAQRLDPVALAEIESELTGERSAEEEFDRHWATAQLEEALRRCEAHFRESDKPGHWGLFEERVLRPALRSCEPPPLAVAAPRAGFPSAANGAAAVQVVKKRLLMLVREVAGESADDDDSYRSIVALLG